MRADKTKKRPDGVFYVPKEGATKYYQPYQVWWNGQIVYFAYTEEHAQHMFMNRVLGITRVSPQEGIV